MYTRSFTIINAPKIIFLIFLFASAYLINAQIPLLLRADKNCLFLFAAMYFYYFLHLFQAQPAHQSACRTAAAHNRLQLVVVAHVSTIVDYWPFKRVPYPFQSAAVVQNKNKINMAKNKFQSVSFLKTHLHISFFVLRDSAY